MISSNQFSDRKETNTAKCPLCGGPNQCALAADPNATECWCDTLTFPRELFVKIPEGAVRKTCVCQNCLTQFQESASDSDNP